MSFCVMLTGAEVSAPELIGWFSGLEELRISLALVIKFRSLHFRIH